MLLDSSLPQLDRLFDYGIGDEWTDLIRPGVRVRVPLRSGARVVDGYVVDVVEDDGDRALSPIDQVVSAVAVMPDSLYRLARRAADRAAGSAADILRLAIPRRMVRAEKAFLASPPPGTPLLSPDALAWSGHVVRAVPAFDPLADGARLAWHATPGVIEIAPGTAVAAWAVTLAALAVQTLARGRSAVLIVPDHRDEEQLLAALRGRVQEDAVVRDDSRRTPAERYAGHLRVLAEQPCIVVGNRSAVYAPARRPGLLALWDDGDPLLAEPRSPGVHARDAALLRQEMEGTALVIAGHTRTPDVERLVGIGWFTEAAPARRVAPRVVLTPPTDGGGAARIPSAAYRAAREGLDRGPVLVQVARPGYAPALVCASCRAPARCAACGGPLRVPARGAPPQCAWCAAPAAAWTCPECAGHGIRPVSAGSERTADELGRAFPGVRVLLSDAAHAAGTVDARPVLVVATRGAEPLAVGGYRAVLLLDGERMLLAGGPRTAESCLRWWSNAAALAAPGAPVHLVGVSGPVARALATWTAPEYARRELAERAALRLPPAVRMAAIDGPPEAVERALRRLHEEVAGLGSDAILGPMPVPDGDGRVRALVRFEYALGAAVASSLRAGVVAAALRSRPRASGAARTTLAVRVDVPDPEL